MDNFVIPPPSGGTKVPVMLMAARGSKNGLTVTRPVHVTPEGAIEMVSGQHGPTGLLAPDVAGLPQNNGSGVIAGASTQLNFVGGIWIEPNGTVKEGSYILPMATLYDTEANGGRNAF